MKNASRSTKSTKTAKFSSVVSDLFKCFTWILVSRIAATSQTFKLQIELDINTEIYPVEEGAFYKLVIASSVNADGSDTFDMIRYENEGSKSGMGTLID